jgi:hypothetical protein
LDVSFHGDSLGDDFGRVAAGGVAAQSQNHQRLLSLQLTLQGDAPGDSGNVINGSGRKRRTQQQPLAGRRQQ